MFDLVKEMVVGLGVSDTPILDLKIKILLQKCLNYLNRTDIPEALAEPIAEHIALYETSGANHGPISTLTEGDTSVSYDNTVNNEIETLFNSLKAQLNMFRVIGTIRR